MKRVAILVCGLGLLTANAQPADNEGSLESRLDTALNKAIAAQSKEAKANEIVKGQITYSGIAVELLEADHPLELINPFAPRKYGSAEDNVLRDPRDGSAAGLNLFSIKF